MCDFITEFSSHLRYIYLNKTTKAQRKVETVDICTQYLMKILLQETA